MNYMGFLANLRARFRGKKADSSVQLLNTSQERVEQMNTSDKLNARDLKYAKEIGKWDVLTDTINKIHENTTVLLERIPETSLTERNFGFYMNELFNKLNTLGRYVEQMNTLPEEKQNAVMEKVGFLRDCLVDIETDGDVREIEILRFIDWRGRSTAREVGYVLNLSRSRTNQILKGLENRNVLGSEKEGKIVYFSIRAPVVGQQ